MGPVLPAAGALTTSEVAVALVTAVATPLNLTVLSVELVLKLVPVMVTWTPAIPDVGLMAVIFGGNGIAGMLFLQALATINKTRLTANRRVSIPANLRIGRIISYKTTSYNYVRGRHFSERGV